MTISAETMELRLKRLEENVRLLCAHVGIPYDDGTSNLPDEIVELVRDGKRIEAIKRYRELTGCDLREAQEAVMTIP